MRFVASLNESAMTLVYSKGEMFSGVGGVISVKEKARGLALRYEMRMSGAVSTPLLRLVLPLGGLIRPSLFLLMTIWLHIDEEYSMRLNVL